MFKCSCCGADTSADYTEPTAQRLKDQQMCFDCDYWQCFADDFVEEHRHRIGTAIIVNGKVYTDGGNKDVRTGMTGHGGRVFKIRMLDGSKEWSTNNLWAGGELPDRWRANIPDNAEFL